MALAKEKSAMAPGLELSCLDHLVYKGQHGLMLEQEGCSQNYSTLLPALYEQSSLMFLETNSSSHEALPVINFKSGADHWSMHSNSALLSFDQKTSIAGDDSVSWIDSMDHDYQMNVHSLKNTSDSCESQGAGYGLLDNWKGENRFEILYSSLSSGDDLDGINRKEHGLQKRQYMGGDIQASKKVCSNNRKQAKAKSPLTSKDPQSIAARIRREKISERLKVLQDLVPNGTKVDLVTMLEKAISYVKFLQLQVKVLATDEFWPAQGGKAPEISQVKDAIDAILSSHRGRN